MKTPQWITVAIAVCILSVLFLFGKTVPFRKTITSGISANQAFRTISFDSLLTEAKKTLSREQVMRVGNLEKVITGVSVKQSQLETYRQLSHFWGDSAGIFEPYAWYEAEYARLVNSEKSLTFAAHLFLNNLQEDEFPERRRWKALQAKDLFERSLKLNPGNDSSRVGLGACYVFGSITALPMEGIKLIREVVDKDSSNIYAQLTLAKGSMLSGQYDKAISRLETAYRLNPDNLEAILLLADLSEKLNENRKAINWYEKSLRFITRQDIREEIEKRIKILSK